MILTHHADVEADWLVELIIRSIVAAMSGEFWLSLMSRPGEGGGGLPYETYGDARRKFLI